MTNEKFYNILMELTNNFTTCIINNNDLLFKTKSELEIEINAEVNKNTTTKQRINYIKKYFDKISLKKPVFKFCTSQLEGFKTVTDTFCMASLVPADFNGLLFENVEDQNEFIYPDIKTLAGRCYDSYKNNTCDLVFTFKLNDVLNQIKLLKKEKHAEFTLFDITNEKNEKVSFSKEVFTTFIKLLNFKNSDIITLKGTHMWRPFVAENKNGSIGLILPCRRAED